MSRLDIFGQTYEVRFDNKDLSSYGFYCYDMKTPFMPQQAQETINIPRRNGLIQTNKKFLTNKLILMGFVYAYPDITTQLGLLASKLYFDTDKMLTCSKRPNQYWNAQYLSYEIVDQRDDYAILNLEFTCNDPFAYAKTEDVDNFDVTVSGTNRIFNNGGHYYAFPVFTVIFNAPQTHIYILNNAITNNRLDISKGFIKDDYLEIDCKNKTIKLNGKKSPNGFGDGGEGCSEWVLLAKGYNWVEVGTDDPNIDVNVNLAFTKVYLY
jgi:predicted phage tail component-like protein